VRRSTRFQGTGTTPIKGEGDHILSKIVERLVAVRRQTVLYACDGLEDLLIG